MPKPITLEMLHEMSPDQRKTLHKNASTMDTDAARDVLALLGQDDLMKKAKVAKKPAAARKAQAKPKKPAAAPKAAVYGPQA